MTDPGPFTPPNGALPPRNDDSAPLPVSPAPVPPVPLATATPPVLPPPTGAPIGVPTYPAVPPPPPPRRRRWLIPVIVGGTLLFASLIVGVAVVAAQLATWASDLPVTSPPSGDAEPGDPTEPEDLVEGEPGDPVASEPLDCATCFAAHDLDNLAIPGGAYVRLGLPVEEGQAFELPMFSDQRDYSDWWTDDGGSPDSCYFTYTQPPLLFEPGLAGDGTSDVVRYATAHYDADGAYGLGEASRVFLTSSAASTHMQDLATAVAGCTEYSLIGAGYAAEVTPAPAFDVPADVAAYGWVETAGLSRFYAADVQRGNVVTRLTLLSDSAGPSEQQFRVFVEEYARALAALDY